MLRPGVVEATRRIECSRKLARKEQDLRFDVPVIGPNTVKLLSGLKAKALVLEKEKTLILDKEKTLSLADRSALPILGV